MAATVPPELLERDDEVELLTRVLTDAAAGRGALVWVEGPAGIGKTRLLDTAGVRAAELGLAVLDARGGELEREFPFGVIRQLLEPRLAATSADEHAALLAGPAALAAPVADVEAVPQGPAADTSFPVLHGLFWLVANLAAREPLAILVDDAHWADPPSMRALAYLARRVGGLPVALLVSARTGEAAADPEALHTLASGAEAVVQLPPLSPRAAARLAAERLGGEVTPAFSHACHGVTGGNPFLVHELLAALAADGAHPDDTGARRVRELGPRAVAHATLARLVRLGSGPTALAQAVAVLGTQSELRQAASLAELDEAIAAGAADALAGAELFRRQRPLDFAHPIVRRCVYEDMPPSHRAELHGRAARQLAEAGGEGVAAHLLATDPAGDAWVVEQLEAAAARATTHGAPDAAVRFLERALAEPPEPAARGRVLGALGAAEARVPSARGRALDHLRQAAELAADPFERLFRSLELGQALLLSGHVEESVEVLDAELQALDPSQSELGQVLQGVLLVASYGSPAARRLVAGRPWRFEGDAEGAPQTPGDRVWLATLALEEGLTGTSFARARDLALRALDNGRLLAEHTADSPVFYLAANTLLYVDALDEALPTLTAAVEDATRRGSLRGFAMASCWRAGVHFWRGALDDAVADARATLESVAEGDLALGVPMATAFLVNALVDIGELDAAESALRSGRTGGPGDDSLGIDLLLHAAGRLRLAQGRPEQALEELRACGRRLEEWAVTTPMLPWRSEAARALVALGRADEAVPLAEEELALVQDVGGRRQLGLALRGVAIARPKGTVATLREAVDVLRESASRLELARTLVDLGVALRLAGERTEARDPLREGLSLARSCGAHALAARAHDELEATGVHQRKILRSGLSALTPSERRIAEMAAGGMSNRDIAAALFVTVRTVEAHLGHVYSKLEIPGRAGLTDALGTPSAH